MIEHSKRYDRLPEGEHPITEVRAHRLDEDGEHPGWLILTPKLIVFLDDVTQSGRHDDYVDHTRFQGMDLMSDNRVGTLVISWSDQGKVYEGDPLELRAFKDAVDDQLSP